MRIAIYTDTISEHQIPLALELVREFGEDAVRYFYVKERALHRQVMMGKDAIRYSWTLKVSEDQNSFEEWTENAEVRYTIYRIPDLIERRVRKGLRTLYMSERWLKPPLGVLRLLHPKYFMMARRMVCCFESGLCTYLPTGIVAASDMTRIAHVVKGHFVKAVSAKRLEFEPHAGGAISGIPWMRMWGYFVKPGAEPESRRSPHNPLRILWVGRYLALKRVDTIVKAVMALNNVELDLFGSGGGERRIKQIANGCNRIHFHPSIPLDEVRKQMRSHDVYVMASNGFDGWGAVVSEAIEEGMIVIGTDKAGASATVLPKQNQFAVGDWKVLAQKLDDIAQSRQSESAPQFVSSKGWRANDASRLIIDFACGKA